jgi:hypothetical protein
MKTSFLLALALALTAPSLQATIVFGNLASLTNGGVSSPIIGTDLSGKAIGFTMGDDSYEITSVTLRLLDVGDVPSVDQPLVTIWTSNGTKPIAQVGAAFTNPVSYTPTTSTNYSFTPTASITLSANQSYFLVVRGNNTDANFSWLAGSPTVVPTGIAGSAIARFGSQNAPVTSYTTSSGNFNWFQIDGTLISSVPEPSTYAAFAGIAMLGLALHRRRPRFVDNTVRIVN